MDSSFGPGVGPIFLDGLNCYGTETRLVECPSNYNYGIGHYADVGVRCLINISPGELIGVPHSLINHITLYINYYYNRYMFLCPNVYSIGA